MQYPVIAQPQYGFAPTFASGGLADAARAVQSRGRNNDTMLVHMTPNEVNSLQGLAMANGGTLTINPNTGLPEADFLDAILPMIAGFALGPAGFALMSAPMAALTVGGLTGIATGDLGKGLMAGLGAFGGANIGGALSSAGTQSLQSQAMTTEVANQVAADAATQAAAAQANTLAGTQLATPMVGSQAGADAILAAAQNAPTGFSSVGAGAKDLFTSGGFDRFGTALSQQAGGGLGATASLAGVGLPITEALQPTYDFPEVAEATSNYAGPYRPTERDVRYPTLRDAEDSSEFQYFTPSNPVPGFEPMYAAAGGYMQRYQEGGAVMPNVDRSVQFAPANYQAGAIPEFSHNFRPVEVYTPAPVPETASQGLAASLFGKQLFGGEAAGSTEQSGGEGSGGIFGGMIRKVLGKADEDDAYANYTDLSKFKYDGQTQRMVPMAQGGLAGLNTFNKGGMPKGRFLQGAGDGTSDSIPATIGGSQPARLADGEFVIDARTVSEIGNGSSKAGAKKLYAMMERVHKERKKAKRGQDSNADRYLPA
jgi:hypothetical protein